ncbi:MAG: hypothetical protein RLZZ440_358 [Planctomycetota bacterium]
MTSASRFTPEAGFGLEGEAAITGWHAPGGDGPLADGLVADGPFFWSAAVPGGVYDVTVTLGHPAQSTAVTVKAESRRLMVQDLRLEPGEFATRSFTVAVKRPTLASGKRIRLKPSQPGSNWDDRLTLEFNGTNPSVAAVTIAPAAEPLTVFIAGDSTVTDQDSALYTGWGQMLPRFFKPGVAVFNNAQSGDSLGSFRGNGLLDQIWETARPGDYLLIQFGHNDQKDKREGAGAFTTYKQDVADYVAQARARQMKPVLVTPMERRRFRGSAPQPTLADYAEAARQVGREHDVPVIDLNAASLKLYEALGPEGSKRVFLHYPAGTAPDGRVESLADDSHFDNYGGFELARIVATGIFEQVPELRDRLGEDFTPFDPQRPDPLDAVVLPLSPLPPAATRPEGS